MKRLIATVFACLCIAVCCLAAKGPGLECEQFFGTDYRQMKDVELTIVTQKNNYYRNLQVRNNPGLVAKILKAVNRDSEKADEVVQRYKQGSTQITLNFRKNGATWTLCFNESDNGRGCRLFLNCDNYKKVREISENENKVKIIHNGETIYVCL